MGPRKYHARHGKLIDLELDSLFAEPAPLQGAARVFDAWGVYDDYNLGDSLENAVAVGFVQDWLSLEEDIFESLSKQQIA